MNKNDKIYIAGHTGLVGSALLRQLQSEGFSNILIRTHMELDLERQIEVENFFEEQRPDHVFLAAAKVGGILANNTYPAEFIYTNMMIESNIIHSAYKSGVHRLLFLGSSCIYPKFALQPMKEEYLLTGELEPTNEPYAIAKIAGIKLCQAYNKQYGSTFLSVMPTNVYGPEDNYNLENSHVIPAMIRKFHLAKLALQSEWEIIKKDESCYGSIPKDVMDNLRDLGDAENNSKVFKLWGTGSPRRELLYVDDLANACIFIMNLADMQFNTLLKDSQIPVVNIGCGQDLTIKELAEKVAGIVGYTGTIEWDHERPDGTPRKLLDISRIEELGWQPKMSLDQGIEVAYQNYLEKY
jgi:GDP-L-fucose synthase